MGASVAAVIVAKERRVVESFRDAGAVSPKDARTTQDVGVAENIGFRRLRDHEVIRETNPGFYYLDEAVWEAVRRTRRRMIVTLLVIVLIASIGAYWGFFTVT